MRSHRAQEGEAVAGVHLVAGVATNSRPSGGHPRNSLAATILDKLVALPMQPVNHLVGFEWQCDLPQYV